MSMEPIIDDLAAVCADGDVDALDEMKGLLAEAEKLDMDAEAEKVDMALTRTWTMLVMSLMMAAKATQ